MTQTKDINDGLKNMKLTPESPANFSIPSSISTTAATGTTDKFRRDRFILSFSGNLQDFYEEDSKSLGEGYFGSVRKGLNKVTKVVRAIKSMQKSKLKDIGRFRQEISIMKKLDHPNVVKLHETYEDHKYVYLIMELCEGGELFDRMISAGHFSESDAHFIFKQVLLSISHCHKHNICHRDLKPENFLFLNKSPDSPLKLTDFGLSAYATSGHILTTDAGTPYYVAPQVLMGKYTNKCDIWSAGVILYILLCGYPPFHGATDALILKKVKTGKFDFLKDDWKGVSEDAKSLIKSMLDFDEVVRFSIDDALNHPWMQQACITFGGTTLNINVISNIRSFRAISKLKKVFLSLIAYQMKESQIKELKDIFLGLDENRDGIISTDEMRTGILKAGCYIPENLEQLIYDMDLDGSGSVDYTEFVAATLDKKQYVQRDACWAAFKTFDVDGNGKISPEELHSVLGTHQIKGVFNMNELAEMRDIVNKFDKNHDGGIDFDEFMEMITEGENIKSNHSKITN